MILTFYSGDDEIYFCFAATGFRFTSGGRAFIPDATGGVKRASIARA